MRARTHTHICHATEGKGGGAIQTMPSRVPTDDVVHDGDDPLAESMRWVVPVDDFL